jgi:hypothetical protein
MAPTSPSGRPRRFVRSPGDLVEIAALTLALTAAGAAVPAGAAADPGASSASSGTPAAEPANGDGGRNDQASDASAGQAADQAPNPGQGQADTNSGQGQADDPSPPPAQGQRQERAQAQPQAQTQQDPPAPPDSHPQANAPAPADSHASTPAPADSHANAPAPADSHANTPAPADSHANAPAQADRHPNANAPAPADRHANAPDPTNAKAHDTNAPARPSPRSQATPDAPPQDNGQQAHGVRPGSHRDAGKPPASPPAPDSDAAPHGSDRTAKPAVPAAPQRQVERKQDRPASSGYRPDRSSPAETRDQAGTRQRGPEQSSPRHARYQDQSSGNADRPRDGSTNASGPGSDPGPARTEGHGGTGRGNGDADRPRHGATPGKDKEHSPATPGRAKPRGGGGTTRPKPTRPNGAAPSIPPTKPLIPQTPTEPLVPQGTSAPVRPIVVSKAVLSRLTPTAAATAAPASRPLGAPTETPQLRTGAALRRPVADLLAVAQAAGRGGYGWGRRAVGTLADAGRGAIDVQRFADVGSPVRTAPLLVAVPSLTPLSDERRTETPADHRPATTPRSGRRSRAAELTSLAAHSILDALLYGVFVGLVFFVAAFALARARLRVLASRAAAARVESSLDAFGTTLASRPEVAQFISAANGTGVRRAAEPSSTEPRTPPAPPRLAAVPSAPASTAIAAEAIPSERRRHGPWQRDEIRAGLLIGCRKAEERNAVLSQRLLRALAQEDARIPSWSVVDRAARKHGQTGGAWLREARRRYRAASTPYGVAAPYGREAALRASA